MILVQLSDQAKIQAALISIEHSVRAESDFHAQKSQQILDQVNLLNQLLNDPDRSHRSCKNCHPQ